MVKIYSFDGQSLGMVMFVMRFGVCGRETRMLCWTQELRVEALDCNVKMFPTIRKSDYTVHMLKEKPRLLLSLSSHSSLEFRISPLITGVKLPSSMPQTKREI
jgi:hypothetical protein